MKKDLIVLGCDPGIANCAFSLVQMKGMQYHLLDTRLVKTKAKESTGKRLNTIHQALCELLDAHTVKAIAAETVFHNRNINSSISTGKVIGLIELAAYQRDLPVSLFTPQQIKQSSGLGGKADKQQMLRMAALLFRSEIKSDHVADACFAATTCLLQLRHTQGTLQL